MRLVDADALKKTFDSMYSMPGNTYLDYLVLLGIKEYIDETPTIDAVPVVHGRWEYNPDDNIPYCNRCGMPQDVPTNYCHDCGARMDAKE